jgi:hypothetical protein
MSIIDSFNRASGKRKKDFIIVYFKKLLLDFIVNNNIFFRAVIRLVLKNYLNI